MFACNFGGSLLHVQVFTKLGLTRPPLYKTGSRCDNSDPVHILHNYNDAHPASGFRPVLQTVGQAIIKSHVRLV